MHSSVPPDRLYLKLLDEYENPHTLALEVLKMLSADLAAQC